MWEAKNDLDIHKEMPNLFTFLFSLSLFETFLAHWHHNKKYSERSAFISFKNNSTQILQFFMRIISLIFFLILF